MLSTNSNSFNRQHDEVKAYLWQQLYSKLQLVSKHYAGDEEILDNLYQEDNMPLLSANLLTDTLLTLSHNSIHLLGPYYLDGPLGKKYFQLYALFTRS